MVSPQAKTNRQPKCIISGVLAVFDTSSEKSLGTPSGHEEHTVLGLVVIREEGSNVECKVAVRVVGRVPARPAERTHHAGGLPIEGVPGRVQLRGRAGVGAQLNSNDSVQQVPEGAVRGVLRALGHLLAGHLQRVPANGAAELRAVEGHRGGEAAALHPEQV